MIKQKSAKFGVRSLAYEEIECGKMREKIIFFSFFQIFLLVIVVVYVELIVMGTKRDISSSQIFCSLDRRYGSNRSVKSFRQ